MMKRIISLCLFLCVAIAIKAQDINDMKYKGFADLEIGIAYNFNTAQLVSTNNMQLFSTITTTHGIQLKQCFVGVGVGYIHSCRDKENIFPMFCAFCYDWKDMKRKPFTDVRLGIVYDSYWISKVQGYGAISLGVELYKSIQMGCRAAIFSRPSRYFTANASVVLRYSF